mmetsp:Transcript_22073/g.63167  ORF Transcript_22073/g.63167 Transcript_22073/m.63167 type:complete len:229 (-) Transcript_22073:518-1204(-)
MAGVRRLAALRQRGGGARVPSAGEHTCHEQLVCVVGHQRPLHPHQRATCGPLAGPAAGPQRRRLWHLRADRVLPPTPEGQACPRRRVPHPSSLGRVVAGWAHLLHGPWGREGVLLRAHMAEARSAWQGMETGDLRPRRADAWFSYRQFHARRLRGRGGRLCLAGVQAAVRGQGLGQAWQRSAAAGQARHRQAEAPAPGDAAADRGEVGIASQVPPAGEALQQRRRAEP